MAGFSTNKVYNYDKWYRTPLVLIDSCGFNNYLEGPLQQSNQTQLNKTYL